MHRGNRLLLQTEIIILIAGIVLITCILKYILTGSDAMTITSSSDVTLLGTGSDYSQHIFYSKTSCESQEIILKI